MVENIWIGNPMVLVNVSRVLEFTDFLSKADIFIVKKVVKTPWLCGIMNYSKRSQ